MVLLPGKYLAVQMSCFFFHQGIVLEGKIQPTEQHLPHHFDRCFNVTIYYRWEDAPKLFGSTVMTGKFSFEDMIYF